MQVSIRWKLLATYLYLTGLAVALLGGYLARHLRAGSEFELQMTLEREAELIASAETPLFAAVTTEHPEGEPDTDAIRVRMQSRCDAAARITNARVTFIDPRGTVLADSQAKAEDMENHSNRPEVAAALHGQSGFNEHLSAPLGRTFMYVAVPVESAAAQGPVGVVRVALSLEQVDRLVGGVTRASVVAIVILIALAVPLGVLWSRRLAEPLVRMSRLTKRIAEGDLEAKVHWQIHDELGELAAGLNSMTARLRKTYERLEEQNRMFETVLARLRAGVIIADAKGNLILANDTASSMLGLELQSTLGKPFIHASLHYELDQALRRCLDEGEPVQIDAVIDRDSGRTVEAMFAPARDGNNELTLVVGVLHDITDRLRTNEMRRQFVANASHELRTPAASIRAMAETLLAGGKDDPERLDRTLNYLLHEGERLGRLISDLLDLAQAEAGDAGERGPVPLSRVANQAARRVRGRAQEKELELTTDVADDLTILSEPRRVEQVLLNLLENAVNYTPEGGRIALAARSENGRVAVSVEDTGIGIADEHLPKIFERFYRVDKARSRETGGTGLGLAIVKHLVASDGGDLAVESTEGEGTTFTVRYSRAGADSAGGNGSERHASPGEPEDGRVAPLTQP